MKFIDYSTVTTVTDLWDKARFQDPNFDVNFGTTTFRRLFEIQPKAKVVFGWSGECDAKAFDARVHSHARSFANLFDGVLQTLGPDTEFMESFLAKLGRQHRHFGVSHFSVTFMGDAMVHALEESLRRPMNQKERDAWDEVYEAISQELIKTILGV